MFFFFFERNSKTGAQQPNTKKPRPDRRGFEKDRREKKTNDLLKKIACLHTLAIQKIWQAHRRPHCRLLQCLSVPISAEARKRVHKSYFRIRRMASMSPASLRRTRAPSVRSPALSSSSLVHSPSALPQGAQGSPGPADSSLRRAAFSSRSPRARASRSATRRSASRCAASRSSQAAMSDWRARDSFPRYSSSSCCALAPRVTTPIFKAVGICILKRDCV